MTCAHKMIYKKNEVRGYRVNIQKKMYFYILSIIYLKMKNKQKIIYNSILKHDIIRENLTKYVKELYTEDHKILLK